MATEKKERKYQSPFRRVQVSKEGGEKIKKLQLEFDRFWRSVNKQADKCPEKFHAIKSMQEACMWLCRAVALNNPHGELEAQASAEQVSEKIEHDKEALKRAIDHCKTTVIVKKRKI